MLMAAQLTESLVRRGRGLRATRTRRRLLPLLLLLVAVPPAGCTSSKVTPPNQRGRTVTTGAQDVSASFPDPIAAADPCAARLQDLCKPLLLYYATHAKRLPQRL